VLDTLISAFSGPGASFMYALTAVLAFGLAILLERLWLFGAKWTGDEAGILAAMGAGDLGAALAAAGNHPAGRILRAAEGISDVDHAWEAMGREAALVQSDVRRRVDHLAMVGNVATMLGLLGTVYGLILAFSALSDASAVEQATRLGEGIATAMATTAWGLLIGIPALAAHALLDAKANRMLAVCESSASGLAASLRS